MKLKCAGCGKMVKFPFKRWLAHHLQWKRIKVAWLHVDCFTDYLDALRLDGVEPPEESW